MGADTVMGDGDRTDPQVSADLSKAVSQLDKSAQAGEGVVSNCK